MPKFNRRKVAALVVEAIELDLPVVATIQEVLGVSFRSAQYMIRQVRTEMYLGVPPHHPVRVSTHKGGAKENSWVACESCGHRWPCPDAYPYISIVKRRRKETVANERPRPRYRIVADPRAAEHRPRADP